MIDLRYVLHGAAIALVWFGVVNAGMAVAIGVVGRRAGSCRATDSAAFWLAVRLLPAVASTAFVGVLFVPSYWTYEPRAVEDLDVTLAILALAALGVICAGAWRGCAAWRRASRRARAWLRLARPFDVDCAIPIYEIPIDAPLMALVGVIRPRLVVTRGVVSALTPDELRAGIAHEIGHLRARDNVKRLAMVAAPDLLAATRVAATIQARWAAAAERAADRAAAGDTESRCALASALVKVAKLTPAPTPLAEPISTLVDGGDIASRVQRLLDDNPPEQPAWSARRLLVSLGIAAVFSIVYGPLLWLVHEATEVIVRTLP